KRPSASKIQEILNTWITNNNFIVSFKEADENMVIESKSSNNKASNIYTKLDEPIDSQQMVELEISFKDFI
ncbi:8442_t:CDS:2, partial [Scutellospora calospora]